MFKRRLNKWFEYSCQGVIASSVVVGAAKSVAVGTEDGSNLLVRAVEALLVTGVILLIAVVVRHFRPKA